MKKQILLIFFCFYTLLSFAQKDKKLDSLLNILSGSKHDTTTLWTTNLIAEHYFDFNPDTAFTIWKATGEKVNALLPGKNGPEKTSLLRTMAEIKNSIGAYYYATGRSDSAIKYWNQSMDIRVELNDDYGIALSLLNMGFFYYSNQNLAKAIECWQKGQRLSSKIKNISLETYALSNLAGVYNDIGEVKKTIEAYLQLIQIKKDNHITEALASNYFNLCGAYGEEKIDKGMPYLLKAYALAKETKDLSVQIQCEDFYGRHYQAIRKNDSALYYFNLAYNKAKSNNYKFIEAFITLHMSEFYSAQGDWEMALKYGLESYEVANIANLPADINNASEILSKIYDKKGQTEKAYFYLKRHMKLNDSLNSVNNKNQLFKKQLEFDTETEKMALQKEQEKRDLIAANEKRQQQIIIYAIGSGLALTLLLLIFIYRSNRIQQRTNKELALKNKLIEHQKQLVEEHRKEILDSIHYAKRIQNSLLPTEKLIIKTIKRLRKEN